MVQTINAEPCIVVGAGPVGLTAALALHRRGVPVIVLEAELEGRERPGSRAIAHYPRTVQRWESVAPGIAEQISNESGSLSGKIDFRYGGRRVFSAAPPSGRKRRSPGGGLLAQKRLEALLLKEAAARDIPIRWNSPISDVTTRRGGVTVTLASGERIDTPYLIGADGARSVVRKSIGVSMEGRTDDSTFIIVDVDTNPAEKNPPAFFHYAVPELGGRNVLCLPFGGGVRIDLQCLPGDDIDHLTSPEGLAEWIGTAVGPWYGEHVQWVSQYRFHQVVADSYTDPHRRVLLAGEAAHLFAPWGGRGLNSGVMDATDAAEAIAAALTADDPAQARRTIERCAAERRAWGLHNRRIAARGLRILGAPDPVMRTGRRIAAALAPWVWPAGAWLANGPSKIPVPRRKYGRWNMY